MEGIFLKNNQIDLEFRKNELLTQEKSEIMEMDW